MDNTLNARNKIVQFCSNFAVILIGLLFVLLSVASILQTCRIDPANPAAEIVNFDNDPVYVNIAFIGLSILGAVFLLRHHFSIGNVSTNFLVAVMLMVTTIVSLAWITQVRSIASGDAMTLLYTARDAANNTYPSFHADYYGSYSYYEFYPFQLGYVLFAELLYRIFGVGCSDMLFQIPNVIALDLVYIGMVKITDKLFERKSVVNFTAILLTLCLQPMFMTTYTYGIIIGLAFSVWSVYHVICFIKSNKIVNAVIAVVLMSLSVLLKYNSMIFVAAVCIALLLHVIDTKRFIAIAVIAAMILCPVGLQKLVIYSYSQRSGVELKTQVSQTLYAYLGISDSGMAPGWYNGRATETLLATNMDVDKANEIASKGISDRLNELSSTNQLGDFYKKKFLSQFNEPSFQSIWLSQVRYHDYPQGQQMPPFVESVYTGGLQKLLDIWFNYYNMMIDIGFTAAMIWLLIRRKLNPAVMILPVTVLGAIIYHMIFEAKSQYILPYFIILIPFAAYGLIESIKALRNKVEFLYR